MGSYQPDPTAVMGAAFDYQQGMLDPALVSNGADMTLFPDGLSLDLCAIPPTTFDELNLVPHNLAGENSGKIDSPDNNMPANNAGAGPLPAGLAVPSAHNAGSTLTEFTKRRNWSQRVIEELKDLMYILTPDGRLMYVSPSVKTLTGYDAAEVVGKSISDFLHPDDSNLFIQEFNESIATGNTLRLFHRFRTAEQKFRIFECHGHPHLTHEVGQSEFPGFPVSPAGICRGFFMMARPYPTRNSELLDSFLEHKIENVRLQARIAALKREEADEADAPQEHYHKQAATASSRTPSISADMTPASPSVTSKQDLLDYNSMPPPAKPTVSNIALTREALDEAQAFARPDSIRDKMARYEGSSHVDSIEMMTGLRYREGERSHSISTGGTSPALIRGDAGIQIPLEKAESRYSYSDKRQKKVKSADEYVCTDCGTLDSPEWRKGPNGPKTLCNACGLRWAKKEKKRTGASANVETASNVANVSTNGANAAPTPAPSGSTPIKESSSTES
ncbi:Cutinase gene palindrome-binding protein [Exophiala dermatitidis]